MGNQGCTGILVYFFVRNKIVPHTLMSMGLLYSLFLVIIIAMKSRPTQKLFYSKKGGR